MVSEPGAASVTDEPEPDTTEPTAAEMAAVLAGQFPDGPAVLSLPE